MATETTVPTTHRRLLKWVDEAVSLLTQAVTQHEVGHFLGLGHSQVNAHVRSDGDASNEALAPCMSSHWG